MVVLPKYNISIYQKYYHTNIVITEFYIIKLDIEPY